MRHLSWQEFDRAVERLALLADGCQGVYGVPRGGLVLAVALSHRLAVPLLLQPQSGCVVVDDVYETGRTVAPYRQRPDCRVLVWISKVEPQWWQAVECTASSSWIVFPWEDAAAAVDDECRYRRSRA